MHKMGWGGGIGAGRAAVSRLSVIFTSDRETHVCRETGAGTISG